MMANVSSFGLYLLATLLVMSGVNHSLALTNNAAENIPLGVHPKEPNKEDRLEMAMQSVMRAVEDGFARMDSVAGEVREIKEELASLKEKLSVSSSCVEGHTPSTPGELDPSTSSSEVSFSAEKRFKAEVGHAVDTFTSSMAALIGQKMDNATVSPTESVLTPPAIPPTQIIPPSSNCYDLQQRGHSASGVYSVTISGKEVKVYCDMESGEGGWTVIQRRDDIEPHEDFNRGWADYKRGFGDLNGEFWLGLDNIHGLTSDPSTPMRLRVELEDWEGEERVALYSTFVVQDEEKEYNLTVGGYEKGPGGEDPGDSLDYHNGSVFSTKDRDNDGWGKNCADGGAGGWWHKVCHYSKLNGLYLKGNHHSAQGVTWYHWKKTHNYSLRRAAMKIRPR